MTYQERVDHLAPFTTYGPNYNRGVRSSLDDSALFAKRGEVEAAERYLLTAEMRAGLITFEEWQEATAAIEGKLAV